jgi:heptosyltransferase-3
MGDSSLLHQGLISAPNHGCMGRALVIRFGAMGDMVQFSAVISNLAVRHEHVDVLGNGGASATVLAGIPGLGRVLSLSHRRVPTWLAPRKARLIQLILRRHYDAVYAFDDVPGLIDRLVASGVMVHRCWTFAVPRLHGVASDAWILAHLGIASPHWQPTVRVRTAASAAIAARLQGLGCAGPVVVFQPGNARTLHPLHRWRPRRNLKAWPAASWAAVATLLLRDDPALRIVIAGAPSETTTADDIVAELPVALRGRMLIMTRDLPVPLLAGLLSHASGCISVDTGPAHLAAALGCPLTVLFGPADPAVMAPVGPAPVAVVRSHVACSPCYGTRRRKTCQRNICMEQITVASVLAAWSRTQAPIRRTG